MNKKRKVTKKITAWLMCLAMVFSIVNLPVFTTAVYAAGYNEGDIPGTTGIGTKTNPVVCDTYEELKAAMENTNIYFVTLQSVSNENGMIPASNTLGTIWAGMSVANQKTLTLDGDSVFVAGVSSTNMPADRLIHVESSGDLTIEGNGSITFKASLTNGSNAVIYNQGNTTVNSTDVGIHGSYNTAAYGRAIFCDYGIVTINGGTFTGVSAINGDTRNISALYAKGGFVLIDGGLFEAYAKNGALGTCYSAEICEDTVLAKGTFTNGILCKGDISDYVDANSAYKIEEDGSVRVFYRPHAITLNGNGNPKSYYNAQEITEQDADKLVYLTADATLSDGKIFDQWVSDNVEITNSTKSDGTACFTMPAFDVSITAVYKTNDRKHTVTTIGEGNPQAYYMGTPISEQEEGMAVALAASETNSNGDAFDKWVSEDVTITNADKYGSAYFTMPSKSVVVKATYKHVHVDGTPVTKNLIDATCSEDGSYDSVVYCSVCNEETGRTHHTIPATGSHTYTKYVSLGSGKHKVVCNDCDAVQSGHDNDDCSGGTATCTNKAVCTLCGEEYGKEPSHGYSLTWSKDATNHWYECGACGDKTEETTHTFGWIIDKPATKTETGSKHEKCSVCGYEKAPVTIDKLPDVHVHSYSTTWDSDATNHWKECECGDKSEEATHTFEWIIEKAATKTETGLKHEECSVCGYAKASVTIDKLPEDHVHTYSTEWKSNTTNHWKQCGCGAKTEDATHSFEWVIEKNATETETGSKYEKCTVCGYEKEAVVIDKLPHSHSYAVTWSKDATNHWKECECTDKKDVATHTFDAGKVTKEATESTEGVKTYTCTVCGQTKTETIPKKEATKPDDKKPEAPKKGDALKDDKTGAQVKVLDPDKKEVVFVAPKDAKAKTITVPATITVNGVTYKVTKINDGAFKGNKTVTKIVLPSSITVIGKDAFNGCSKLKTITIPKNVIEIGANAFKGCASITKITLPSKVAKIGANAFNGCKTLKTLTIKTSKLTDKNVGSKAFKGINAKAKVKVPKAKLKAYKKILKKKGISGKNQKITK